MHPALSFIAPALALAVAAFSSGYQTATVRHERAQAKAEQQTAALIQTRFDQAQAWVNQRSLSLVRREAALNETAWRLKHELPTTGGACLGTDAVRLLNGSHPTLSPVPEASAAAAPENGAAASDTDIAHWAATAWSQYEICRGRLSDLVDFYEEQHP